MSICKSALSLPPDYSAPWFIMNVLCEIVRLNFICVTPLQSHIIWGLLRSLHGALIILRNNFSQNSYAFWYCNIYDDTKGFPPHVIKISNAIIFALLFYREQFIYTSVPEISWIVLWGVILCLCSLATDMFFRLSAQLGHAMSFSLFLTP